MPSINISRRQRDPTMELRLSTASEISEDPSEEFVFSPAKAEGDAQQNQWPRKNVRFFRRTTVRVVPKWLKKEHSEIWLSREELSEIRKECIFTLKECMNSENMSFFFNAEDPKYCGRGLESKTQAGERRRQLAKAQSRSAVLDEQYSQWYGGIRDDEAIAEKYATYTRSSSRLARVWGLKDEQEAKAMR